MKIRDRLSRRKQPNTPQKLRGKRLQVERATVACDVSPHTALDVIMCVSGDGIVHEVRTDGMVFWQR